MKINIRIISITLILALLLQFSFLLVHFNHNCNDHDNCPICNVISLTKNSLFDGKLSNNIVLIIFILTIIYDFYYEKKIIDKSKLTLIGLKIELNN